MCVFFNDSEDNIPKKEESFNPSSLIAQSCPRGDLQLRVCLDWVWNYFKNHFGLCTHVKKNVFRSKRTRGYSMTTLAAFQGKRDFVFTSYFVLACAWRTVCPWRGSHGICQRVSLKGPKGFNVRAFDSGTCRCQGLRLALPGSDLPVLLVVSGFVRSAR